MSYCNFNSIQKLLFLVIKLDFYIMEENDMSKNKVDQCCETCEFNTGTVCMGSGRRIDNGENTYGMPIEEAMNMFPNGCEDWGISFSAFIEEEES